MKAFLTALFLMIAGTSPALSVNLAAPIRAALLAYEPPPEPCRKDCRISPVGIRLIQFFEGYSPLPYRDTGNKWTIGYGHLILPGERFDGPLLGEAADRLFLADIAKHEVVVNRVVIVPMHQLTYDAVLSLFFNVGPGRKGLKDGIAVLVTGQPSTLLRKLNAADYLGACDQFPRWNKVAGKPSRGLTIRRGAERELCLIGAHD
ncbi:MAG: lysozyme [Acetobacteraceae bacterium]